MSTNNINIKFNRNANKYLVVDSSKEDPYFNEGHFDEPTTPIRERYLEALKSSEDCIKMLSNAKNLLLKVTAN